MIVQIKTENNFLTNLHRNFMDSLPYQCASSSSLLFGLFWLQYCVPSPLTQVSCLDISLREGSKSWSRPPGRPRMINTNSFQHVTNALGGPQGCWCLDLTEVSALLNKVSVHSSIRRFIDSSIHRFIDCSFIRRLDGLKLVAILNWHMPQYKMFSVLRYHPPPK